MLLPYSASNARRSTFWALLWLAVLGPAVLVAGGFVGFTPWLAFPSLLSGVAAIGFLCVWCAIYLRDEPRLARIALIWIALLILSLLITIGVSLARPRHLGPTKAQLVEADIQSIRMMLLSYHGANGRHPTTVQGLNTLVPRFLEELPKDAWGTPYIYRNPGTYHPSGYDLFSAGPDRVADTADDEWGK